MLRIGTRGPLLRGSRGTRFIPDPPPPPPPPRELRPRFSLAANHLKVVKGFDVVFALLQPATTIASGQTASVTFVEAPATSGLNNYVNTLIQDIDAAIAANPLAVGNITRSGLTLTFNWAAPRSLWIQRPTNTNATYTNTTITKATTISLSEVAVVTSTGHGFAANDSLVFTTTGALPEGFSTNVTYYALAPTANTLNISATPGGPALYATKAGSGTYGVAVPQTGTVTISVANPAVVTLNAHGLTAGTAITFTTTGALPAGLSVGQTYYVLVPTANTFTVSATSGGAAIATTATGSGTHGLAVVKAAAATIAPISPATLTAASHGAVVDELVTLTTTGALPAGLSTGTRYYVVAPTANTLTLSATFRGAAIATTSAGSGTHTLVRVPKYDTVSLQITSANADVAAETTDLAYTLGDTGTVKVQLVDQFQGHPAWSSPRAPTVQSSLRFDPDNDNLGKALEAKFTGTTSWGGVDSPKVSIAFGLSITKHDGAAGNFFMSNNAWNNIKILRAAFGKAISQPQLICKLLGNNTVDLVNIIAEAPLQQNIHSICYISVDLTKDNVADGFHMWIDDVNATPPTMALDNAGNPRLWRGSSTSPPSMSWGSNLKDIYLMGASGVVDDIFGDFDFFWLKTGVALDFRDPAIREKFWADTIDAQDSIAKIGSGTSGAPVPYRGGAPLGGGSNRPDLFFFGNREDFIANPSTNSYGIVPINLRVPTAEAPVGSGWIPSDRIKDIVLGTPAARTVYASVNEYQQTFNPGVVSGLPTGAAVVNTYNGYDVSGWKTTFAEDFIRTPVTTPGARGYYTNGDLTEGGQTWETVFPQFRDQNGTSYRLRVNSATQGLYVDFHGTQRRTAIIDYASFPYGAESIIPGGGWAPGALECISFAPNEPNGVISIGGSPLYPYMVAQCGNKTGYRNKPFEVAGAMITSDGRVDDLSNFSGSTNMLFGMNGATLVECKFRFKRWKWPYSPIGQFPAVWTRRPPNGPGAASPPYEDDWVEAIGSTPDVWCTTPILDGSGIIKRVNRNLRGLEQGLTYGPWMLLSVLVTPDDPVGSASISYYRDGTIFTAEPDPNQASHPIVAYRNGKPANTQVGATLTETNPTSNESAMRELAGGYRHILATMQMNEGYNVPNMADFTTDWNSTIDIDFIKVRQPVGGKFIRKGVERIVTSTTTETTL